MHCPFSRKILRNPCSCFITLIRDISFDGGGSWANGGKYPLSRPLYRLRFVTEGYLTGPPHFRRLSSSTFLHSFLFDLWISRGLIRSRVSQRIVCNSKWINTDVEHASIMAIITTLSILSVRSRRREKEEETKRWEKRRKGKKRWEAFVRFPCSFVQSVACS